MAAGFFYHTKYYKSFVWNNTTLNLELVILCYSIRHKDASKTKGDPLIDVSVYSGNSIIFKKRMSEKYALIFIN